VENKPKYPFPKPIVSIYVDSRELFKLMSATTGDFHEYSVFWSVLKDAAVYTYLHLFHKSEAEDPPAQVPDPENGGALSNSRSRKGFNRLEKIRQDLLFCMTRLMSQSRIVLLLDNLQDIPSGIIFI
jgi:hypothetical protein